MTVYPWPGNIRELQNTVERMIILSQGDQIKLQDLPVKLRTEKPLNRNRVVELPPEGYPLEEIERDAVIQALERNNWNKTRAAEFLQVPRHTLIYRMDKYEVKKP